MACDAPGPELAPVLVGAWKEEGGDRLLNIEADRIIEKSADGKLIIRGLIRQDGNNLVLREEGFRKEWTATVSGGLLWLEARDTAKPSAGTFHRLDRVPAEVRLEPLSLAVSSKPSPDRIQKIQAEIAARFKAEQALLKNRAPREEVDRAFAANLSFLRGLLQDVGWIDSPRFGAQTSVYAVILAKHTRDLPLMMTVLPFAEHDLKSSGDGQTYAVLYDALQLDLGKKQLYGTQISEDDKGPFVLPMEESRDKVNERLTKMGLPNLDEYLSVVSKAMFQGKTVQVRQDG
jgi:hypothetical protein